MLTSECVWAYREQFNTNSCAFEEPGSCIVVENQDTGVSYISPPDETEKVFMDRLERCKREQRNLFFEEWEAYKAISDVLY